ncbi:MAG: hypothetical protein WC787_00590 [Patescibacteria group bacterium]|jgi:hypothetical protein
MNNILSQLKANSADIAMTFITFGELILFIGCSVAALKFMMIIDAVL